MWIEVEPILQQKNDVNNPFLEDTEAELIEKQQLCQKHCKIFVKVQNHCNSSNNNNILE